MTATGTSLWMPARNSAARVLTSATLDVHADGDEITLYVRGARVASFRVASGLGALLLDEFGMVKVP